MLEKIDKLIDEGKHEEAITLLKGCPPSLLTGYIEWQSLKAREALNKMNQMASMMVVINLETYDSRPRKKDN